MNLRHYFSMQHILALVSFVYSVTYIAAAIIGEMKNISIVSAIGTFFLCLCSLSVLLRKEPDVYFTAGIMGIGFGLHMLFSFVIALGGDFNIDLGDENADAAFAKLTFILGVIGIIAGLLTLMFSIPLYCGNRYDTKRILIMLGAYLVAYLLPTTILVAFFGRNFFKILEIFALHFLFFIPVVLYIVMIYRTDVGYKGVSSRYNSNIKSLTDSLYSDQNTYVWRSDVIKIANKDEIFEQKNDGHIVSEATLPLIIGGKDAHLVIQNWDNGCKYGMIMRHEEGTLIQTLRFEVSELVTEDGVETSDSFIIYGKDGFFVKILIRDEEVKPSVTGLRKLLIILTGSNSRY